jgi:hypothetical protein
MQRAAGGGDSGLADVRRLPLDGETLAALNPNRLWVRKLLKGKQVK